MSDQTKKHRFKMFFFGEKRWYRDFWLFMVSLAVLFALLSFKGNQDDITQGRKDATTASCAINQAFLSAGQGVITAGGVEAGGEFEKNLIELGYPNANEREESSKKAADAYAKFISDSVEKDTGIKGIIDEQGRVDCKKIAQIARVDGE